MLLKKQTTLFSGWQQVHKTQVMHTVVIKLKLTILIR